MEGDLRLVGSLLEEDNAIQGGHANVELDDGTTATLVHSPADEQGVIDHTHVEMGGRLGGAGGLEGDQGSGSGVGLLNTVAVSETPGKGIALTSGQTGDLQGKGELDVRLWKIEKFEKTYREFQFARFSLFLGDLNENLRHLIAVAVMTHVLTSQRDRRLIVGNHARSRGNDRGTGRSNLDLVGIRRLHSIHHSRNTNSVFLVDNKTVNEGKLCRNREIVFHGGLGINGNGVGRSSFHSVPRNTN